MFFIKGCLSFRTQRGIRFLAGATASRKGRHSDPSYSELATLDSPLFFPDSGATFFFGAFRAASARSAPGTADHETTCPPLVSSSLQLATPPQT